MERKDTILIACASQENRSYLRYVLSERFHLLESANFQQMQMLLEANKDCIATVVIGTSVIDQETQEQIHRIWQQDRMESIPVVILNETGDSSKVNAMFQRGAADVIDLHYDAYATLHRIDTVAQLHKHRQHMEQLIQERSAILRQSNDTMVDVLSSIIEYRSAESCNHVLRIRKFTRILLEEVMHRCPEYRLTPRVIDIICSASALHDVGKIAIPDAILLKPGPLSADEWEIMKTHSATGCQILESMGAMADQEYLKYARNICLYHHERWDGNGYPEGLSGDQIPICAQVVGLADAYEALVAERSYKVGFTFDQAINMILKGECGVFSPKLLACLKNCTEAYEALTNAYSDGRSQENHSADMTLPSPEVEVSSLERVQAMYYCLVHYINGFLMEVNLDQGLFHVVYNPYPELARLEGISKLNQLIGLMLDAIVVPEDRERMQKLIYEEIPRFVDEDLRRLTHRFRYQVQEAGESGLFEATLLRVGVSGSKRRSLAILFRKLSEGAEKDVYSASRYTLAENDYICRNDQHFTLVSLEREASTLAGYTAQELKETYNNQLSRLIHPDDRKMVRDEFSRQLKHGTSVQLEHRVVCKSGEVLWVVNKSRLVMSEDGYEHLYCFLTDITKTRTAFASLQQHHQRYIEILNKTENCLFEWDVEKDAIEFSDTWGSMFAHGSTRLSARAWLARTSRIHPDDVPLLLDRVISLESGSEEETQELRISNDQGRYIWCRVLATANRDERGKLKQIMGVITGIEAEKEKERALKDRAERDSLTKLLNKEAAQKRITAYLSHYPQGASCAMLLIDLDDFKNVNDTFGHLFGDAVLAKVAQDIKRQFKGQDIVCRIGGDEFLVLVRGLTDRMLLEDRCRRLLSAFCESLKVQHKGFQMSCSIGIALAPAHGNTYHELFAHADQALYRAKAKGKNTYRFYDPEHSSVSAYRGSPRSRIDSDEEPGLAENSFVRHAFRLLYTSDNVKAAINEAIAYLGRQMNVSRVYIFENTEDNRHCSNTFEWCNEGIAPQIQNLQNVSYEEDIPGYLDCFDEQGLIYCTDIQELPKPVHDILEPQGIVSMLHCAIRPDGQFRGYIGFDECVHPRLWTREEIQMLAYFTEVLATFLMKARRQEKITSQAEDILTLLDNQNTWIYIIDPETWELKYLNKKARDFLPQAKCGEPCYKTIQGRSEFCPNCPAIGILEKKTERRIQGDSKEKLLFEASLTRWEGRNGCMVTCRLLPKEGL